MTPAIHRKESLVIVIVRFGSLETTWGFHFHKKLTGSPAAEKATTEVRLPLTTQFAKCMTSERRARVLSQCLCLQSRAAYTGTTNPRTAYSDEKLAASFFQNVPMHFYTVEISL